MNDVRVLIALDDSPVSEHAARVGVKLFQATGATFLVINVSAMPVPWVGDAGFGAVAPLALDVRWLEQQTPADDDAAEHDLMGRAATAGIPEPVPVVEIGDPVERICAAAAEHDVDVIVVGSHGKTALRRLFDPSVAEGVTRGTDLPVLVVSDATTR